MKHFWTGVVDLFYDIHGYMVEIDKNHRGQWWLFTISYLGFGVIGIWFGNSLYINLWHTSGITAFLNFLSLTLPIWLPLFLFITFYEVWMEYIRMEFIIKQGSVLLEIKLPKIIEKSPLAMEIFFTALYQTGSSTVIDTFWSGKIRPWFSCEMVSDEGKVRFFIWTHKKYKELVETQLYAQYPDISVHEVPDYTTWVHHDPENLPLWGCYFKLTKEDVYPIKTYVDYGLDKESEDVFKADPMSSVLEYLGSLGKGEHVWFQILIRAHKTQKWTEGAFGKQHDWKEEAEEEIKKIREKATPEQTGDYPGFPNPTKGQVEAIAAIERSIGKFPYETMIRAFYIAKKESFSPNRFSGLIGSFRQYSSNYLNGFRLGPFTDFDYPWQDFRRWRRNRLERNMLDAYKWRSFFYPPFKFYRTKPFILMTEELATIFHFPSGLTVATPTMARIPSKRAQPPPNLPI